MATFLSPFYELHLVYVDPRIHPTRIPSGFHGVHGVRQVADTPFGKGWIHAFRWLRKISPHTPALFQMSFLQCIPRAKKWLGHLVDELQPVAVIGEYAWSLCPAVLPLRKRKIPIFLDTIDVLSDRYRRAVRSGAAEGVTRVTLRQERAACRKADVLIAIQSQEAEWFTKEIPEKKVITVGHSCGDPLVGGGPAACCESEIPSALFVGSGSHHNVDALRSLLESAWPQVIREIPGAALHVVGSVCDSLTEDLPPNVHVHGRVDDLEACFREAWVSLNIPRFGGGLKIKAIEGFRRGCAQLMTPMGAEGLEPYEDRAYVRTEVADIGSALAELLRDRPACMRLAEGAADVYRTSFTPEQVYAPLLRELESRCLK